MFVPLAVFVPVAIVDDIPASASIPVIGISVIVVTVVAVFAIVATVAIVAIVVVSGDSPTNSTILSSVGSASEALGNGILAII